MFNLASRPEGFKENSLRLQFLIYILKASNIPKQKQDDEALIRWCTDAQYLAYAHLTICKWWFMNSKNGPLFCDKRKLVLQKKLSIWRMRIIRSFAAFKVDCRFKGFLRFFQSSKCVFEKFTLPQFPINL